MGVIGIVAALTIPNLNSSTNDMEKVTKFKKIYAQLNEAQSRATAVYGPIEEWFLNDGCTLGINCATAKKRYFDRITEFMKVTKSCRDTVNNCTANTDLLILGGGQYRTTHNVSGRLPQAVFADNFSIIEVSIAYFDCSNKDNYAESNAYCGHIFIDIDGPDKGKNTWGIDLFSFAITSDGLLPYYSATAVSESLRVCTYRGYGCAVWVLENGNMDYLYVNHDLSGIYMCKNSRKILTWDSPTCK